MTRFGFLSLLILALAGAPAVRAVADDDHDRAREALQRGEIRPLSEILSKLQNEIPCEILQVEFERDDGAWLYELKAIDSSGRYMKISIDAATGKVLKVKKKHENPDR